MQKKNSVGVRVANDVTVNIVSGVLSLRGFFFFFSAAPVLTTGCLSVEVHPLTSFTQRLAKLIILAEQKPKVALTKSRGKLIQVSYSNHNRRKV